jgi:hypothetical protein
MSKYNNCSVVLRINVHYVKSLSTACAAFPTEGSHLKLRPQVIGAAAPLQGEAALIAARGPAPQWPSPRLQR